MAITYIDFYAENPIHDKTLDNTNIYDAITGNSTNILDITNPSQDIRITNTEGIIFDANNDISLSTQADFNQVVVGNQNITTVGTMYINYFGAVPSPSFTPKHVYFGQYASTPTTVHFIDNSTIKIPGGNNGDVLSTDGAGNLSFIAPSGGGVSDGDYGDITVSSSGSVWTIDNSVVTYGKMQDASGHSVLGRSSNTSGAIAEITSTGNGEVLHRNGSNLVFATIGDSSITASSITYSRLQNVSTNNRLLGRSTAGAGSIEEITVGSGLTLTSGTLSASGGGLTYFTESQNTTGVNATIYADRLIPNGVATSIDFVIQPKANGSLLAQIPDGTSTGGDKRGTNAIDLQFSRSASTQVAGAIRSAIIGGASNRINSTGTDGCGIFGGEGNTISGYTDGIFVSYYSTITSSANNSVIVGGTSNQNTGGGRNGIFAGTGNTSGSYASVILGGNNNTNSTSSYTGILSGESNQITATGGFNSGNVILGGKSNVLSGLNNGKNAIVAGVSNSMNGQYSVQIGGDSNTITDNAGSSVCLGGELNYLNSSFSTLQGRYGFNKTNGSDIISASPSSSIKGSNQGGRYVFAVKTTSTSATKLIAPAANALEIFNGESVAYRGIICARTSASPGKSAYYEINGLVRNSSGVLTLLYSNLVTNYTDDATWVITQQCPTYWFEVLFTGDANTYVTCHLITSHSKWIAS